MGFTTVRSVVKELNYERISDKLRKTFCSIEKLTTNKTNLIYKLSNKTTERKCFLS